MRRLAPIWEALGVTGSRQSFLEEIERIMAEVPSGSDTSSMNENDQVNEKEPTNENDPAAED